MKAYKLLFALVITILMQLISFANEEPDSLYSSIFEIYVTKNIITYDPLIDYSKINLDTIQLNDAPLLTINEIESYDSSNHIINLKMPIDSLKFPSVGVYGRMFVVLTNKEPVYCGFFWTLASSVPCPWIVIKDSNELNGLTDTQIQISAGYPDSSWFHGNDPRNSPVIINSLKQINILTGNISMGLKSTEIYPNPTTGKITVAGLTESEKSHISIYNEIGELIKRQDIFSASPQIDLSELSSGIYFLKNQLK